MKAKRQWLRQVSSLWNMAMPNEKRNISDPNCTANGNFCVRDLRRHSWIGAAMLAVVGLASQEVGADNSASALKGEYFLSRTPVFDPVCPAFTRNLNQFRKLDFDQCHPRLSSKFPEFSRPYKWEAIPLDLALAEKAIRSSTYRTTTDETYRRYNERLAEERWRQWLKDSESLRASGAVRMWLTKIDIDGDGKEETLLRLLPGGRYRIDPNPPPPWTCDYNLGELYVVESGNPGFAEEFNVGAVGADIIHFASNNHFYLAQWRNVSSDGVGYDIPNIGATGSVILYRLHQPATHVIGLAPRCLIDWVPTGKYRRPVKQGRPQSPATSR